MSGGPLASNPLDAWTAALIGLPESPLTRCNLDAWQWRRLRETVAWAQQRSPFYRLHLHGINASDLTGPGGLRCLPLMTADDLRRNDPPLLCISQSEISRIVTLETSGTSGFPKRLFFTSEDQEATLDFFDHGMRLLTRVGDRVLIFFPGERPGSVGDLLARAVARLGATPIPFGWPHDLAAAAEAVRREEPDVIAGVPVPLLAVARMDAASRRHSRHVRSVLLSADHAAGSLRRSLAALWECEVFEHYGMTEMGLGGGVDCAAHAGYHVRESELLVEVVDPLTGESVAPGEEGEVVVTTLVRRGMPLIRYRTGDVSRLLPGTCACGSPLLRLDRIARRVSGGISLGDAGELTIGMLDEALFVIGDIVDFDAAFQPGISPVLKLLVSCTDGRTENARMVEAVSAALEEVPVIAAASRSAGLRLQVDFSPCGLLLRSGKRTIREDVA